jgi:hypothetical protein
MERSRQRSDLAIQTRAIPKEIDENNRHAARTGLPPVTPDKRIEVATGRTSITAAVT